MPTALSAILTRGKRRQNLKVLTSPPALAVVTTNLVLHLDAGNVASYPGSGSTWYDLSTGARNCTLTNSPIYSSNNGGYLTFDGLDEYGTINNHADFDFGTGDFTIEYWANCQDTVNDLYQMIGGNHVAGIGGGWYAYAKDNNNKVAVGFSAQVTSTFTISQNAWVHIVMSRISGLVYFYKNNVSEAGRSFTNSLTSSNAMRIAMIPNYGNLTDGTYHFDGHIAQLRIYKALGLTAAQVDNNFTVGRSRYGV
jgi:hypothetical protein